MANIFKLWQAALKSPSMEVIPLLLDSMNAACSPQTPTQA